MVQVEIIKDKIYLLTKGTLYTNSATYSIDNIKVKVFFPNTMRPARVEELLHLNSALLRQYSKLH